jgi:dinuclear metal center YbgI/SA1388 family protein
MKLREIVSVFESFAPLAYQENYDNSGLAVGDPDMDVTATLLCVDVTIEVVEEAKNLGANLVISHHPVVFKPLSKLTGSNSVEKIILLAVRNNIALYSAHTNLDNVLYGVNHKICSKLGLAEPTILVPRQHALKKLVAFVPDQHADAVRNALFDAGAGHIGNYDTCSFNNNGFGTFRALEGANPYVGEVEELHRENETRIETIFPAANQKAVIQALLKSHPYEEPAFDIYPVDNSFQLAGSGMMGKLAKPINETDFLEHLKTFFKCRHLKHSRLLNKPISKIAVCGGSGSFLIPAARTAGADLFITGDVKYHEFFNAEDRILIADIGHYESEQFTIEIFYDILIKIIPNFAIHFSSINTNPIYYI